MGEVDCCPMRRCIPASGRGSVRAQRTAMLLPITASVAGWLAELLRSATAASASSFFSGSSRA